MTTPADELAEDPFYASAHKILGSLSAIRDAGWFGAGPETIPAAGPEWMSVPFEKLRRRLAEPTRDPSRPIAVLLTTGAFNPLHIGHVELMTAARTELELRGWFVAGGYFSPSHDAYVASKLGDQALDAVARLELCQVVCAASEWLMAADWEALGVDRAVNFTTVISWLGAYLARHLGTTTQLEIFYVFGSDNARFTRAFVGHGRCVCVVRPGFDAAVERYATDPHVQANPRILFARHSSVSASSSLIRTGRTDLMEARSRARWVQALARRDRTATTANHGTYVLRDECGWEVTPWLPGRDEAQLRRARRWFHDQLTCLLRQAHKNAGTTLDFHWLDLDTQRAEIAALPDSKVLSIDAPIAGHVDLAVSRRFALSGAHIPPELCHRPGSPPLTEQIQHIPPGRYVLVDDDVCTGATLAGIRALLPDRVVVEREHILFRKHSATHLDVLDCRDFLAGAREGGLVVTCPDGTLARAPYCLPYVSACERASVPLAEELSFSRAVWDLDATFFASITPAIVLAEADPAFRRLMQHLGFADTTPLADICRWHAARCADTIARASLWRTPRP